MYPPLFRTEGQWTDCNPKLVATWENHSVKSWVTPKSRLGGQGQHVGLTPNTPSVFWRTWYTISYSVRWEMNSRKRQNCSLQAANPRQLSLRAEIDWHFLQRDLDLWILQLQTSAKVIEGQLWRQIPTGTVFNTMKTTTFV